MKSIEGTKNDSFRFLCIACDVIYNTYVSIICIFNMPSCSGCSHFVDFKNMKCSKVRVCRRFTINNVRTHTMQGRKPPSLLKYSFVLRNHTSLFTLFIFVYLDATCMSLICHMQINAKSTGVEVFKIWSRALQGHIYIVLLVFLLYSSTLCPRLSIVWRCRAAGCRRDCARRGWRAGARRTRCCSKTRAWDGDWTRRPPATGAASTRTSRRSSTKQRSSADSRPRCVPRTLLACMWT